ncbi:MULTISPECIES: OmpW/AlkL family protein [Burkholderia]|uniref:OmpW/AlkL family protein n=1 Tax=Burkholderia TaxID=32008 RepID=UPI000756662E|nr:MULTISPECIES: OmpW family outer membrane protein [Burkholderia]AOJ71406.1 OmpW family protein [Burkholderia savannae]KVG36936.1 OmpW family protein [Burkholderia sp. MSMB0265]KVG79168.1 OmpW family protein [Burkholderia sp. MSMB2040]KVG93627.1 OmpW family protein [Burkholderia sp. MSMB2041]KVG95749.1 OmpW family protein [Burkholderia sp. MSMB2042]
MGDKHRRRRARRGWRAPVSCWLGATLLACAWSAHAQDGGSAKWRDGADGIGFFPGGDAPGFDANAWGPVPGDARRASAGAGRGAASSGGASSGTADMAGAAAGAGASDASGALAASPNAPRPRRLTEETITLGQRVATPAAATRVRSGGGGDGIGFADAPGGAPADDAPSADACGGSACAPDEGAARRPPADAAPRFIAGVRYDRMPYELHPIDPEMLPDLPEAQGPTLLEQLRGDDSNMIGIGWHYVLSTGRSTPVTTTTGALGIGSFVNPGSAVSISNANTPAFTFTHFFGEHVAAEIVGGIPPELTMRGHGSVGLPFDKIFPGVQGRLPLVDLGNTQSNPLGTTRAWLASTVFKYYLGKREDRLRPYVGLGISYTRFTNSNLSPVFANKLTSLGGLLSAGISLGDLQSLLADPSALDRLLQAGANLVLSNGVHATASVKSTWTPVFVVGANYQLTRQLSLSTALSYIPLKAAITLNINDAKRILASNTTTLSANVLLCTMLLNYRF